MWGSDVAEKDAKAYGRRARDVGDGGSGDGARESGWGALDTGKHHFIAIHVRGRLGKL